MSGSLRVGVDIGGTFTDLILVDDATGELTVGEILALPHSTPTPPPRPHAPAPEVPHVIHGTTLVTNAIIERKGARTALLTTAGFRDAIEIGRAIRFELYAIHIEQP